MYKNIYLLPFEVVVVVIGFDLQLIEKLSLFCKKIFFFSSSATALDSTSSSFSFLLLYSRALRLLLHLHLSPCFFGSLYSWCWKDFFFWWKWYENKYNHTYTAKGLSLILCTTIWFSFPWIGILPSKCYTPKTF